ncbi:hypothetical protein [Streptomyces jumonjinensis]|uniref:Uncharacterized protein n=1 Tax=Streptomyces jumonjinensis TaxID=1945 RepID=A0A646KRL4_STRJU|nr:hypothetical protein [Streptomyces jumonjinensis]MQT04974.1 hypothetical protein [Streptomyces jumonjinensis]
MRDPLEAAEDELRLVLERATPELAAPGERLGQVRARIVRRRRRRTGAAVLVAAVLAGVGTVLPQTLRENRPEAPPAAPTPAPLPTREKEREVRFDGLHGFTIPLTKSWHTLEVPAVDKLGAVAMGYIGTQKLSPFERPCGAKLVDQCAPVDKLGSGDVLVTVSVGALPDAGGWGSPTMNPVDIRNEFCERIGGSEMFVANAGFDAEPSDLLAVMSVCVDKATSAKTLDDLQELLYRAHPGEKNSATAPGKQTGGTRR